MNEAIEPQKIWQSLSWHLIPGVLITIFIYFVTPLLMKAGFPTMMGIMMAILVILIPFELGYLLYQSKKSTGRLSIKAVISEQKPVVWWQFALIVTGLIFWCGLIFISMAPVDKFITNNWFSWLPPTFIFSLSPDSVSQYPAWAVKVTVIAAFILNGFAGPIVEELYFRGYLLPRIPVSRVWAPLVNVVLFSLYHFFSPWQNFTRILAMIPMVYAVAWKRNIYLSMATHCIGNTIGMIGLLSLLAA
jgi:membrane protease YdiL (CAAX protease family)